MTQYFKGDETELKYFNSGKPIADTLSAQKTTFFDEAYSCFVLGELLYDNNLSPLANAIPRAIFRESFASIYAAFVQAGTFESYLTVFRQIFGDSVVVDFTVPAAGKLNIDITAAGVVYKNFVARSIVNNAYVYSQMVDDDGDNLVFQGVKGFETEYELEQMLNEMVPAGIYTEITLTLGA
jgi:hypothetical protein